MRKRRNQLYHKESRWLSPSWSVKSFDQVQDWSRSSSFWKCMCLPLIAQISCFDSEENSWHMFSAYAWSYGTKIINKTRGSTREVSLRSHIFMSRTGQVLRRHSALIWSYEICRRNQMIRNFGCVNSQLICSQDGNVHVEDPSRQRRASSFLYT